MVTIQHTGICTTVAASTTANDYWILITDKDIDDWPNNAGIWLSSKLRGSWSVIHRYQWLHLSTEDWIRTTRNILYRSFPTSSFSACLISEWSAKTDEISSQQHQDGAFITSQKSVIDLQENFLSKSRKCIWN